MQAQTFHDVFDALADTPGEAANLKVRADLVAALTERVRTCDVPDHAAAGRLGISNPCLQT